MDRSQTGFGKVRESSAKSVLLQKEHNDYIIKNELKSRIESYQYNWLSSIFTEATKN